MSALIAVRLDGVVVVATDSRFMRQDRDGNTEIFSDSGQKVFELKSGLFFAVSGGSALGVWLTARARELAERLNTSDIREIAQALDSDKESAAPFVAYLGELCQQKQGAAVMAGEEPFQGYVIGGLIDGVPSFVTRLFFVRNQKIVYEHFEPPAGQFFSIFCTRGKLVRDLYGNKETWVGGAVAGVEKLLDAFCQLHPEIGGPKQMVEIKEGGSRWVHQLPVEAQAYGSVAAADYAGYAATFDGQVSARQIVWDVAVGAELHIESGNATIDIAYGVSTSFGSNDGVAIKTNDGSGQLALGGLAISLGGPNGTSGPWAQMTGGGFSVHNPGYGDVAIDYTGVFVGNHRVVSTRVESAPTTLADVISVLQHHGLCV